MLSEHKWRTAAIATLFLFSAVVLVWIAKAGFSPCAMGKFTEEQIATIKSLDAIVDLSLKLATTLVGFGAAALVGLKQGLKLSASIKLLIVVATVLFAESALYATWWRLGVAEVYYNQCFDIVGSPRLQLRFEWHIYFFMLGLTAIAGMVLEALFRKPERESDT